MDCSLCEMEISNYSPTINQLKIDEKHVFEICSNCIDKIMKWQQKSISKLFPTNALKKRFN